MKEKAKGGVFDKLPPTLIRKDNVTLRLSARTDAGTAHELGAVELLQQIHVRRTAC